jgi:hypothetical protein
MRFALVEVGAAETRESTTRHARFLALCKTAKLAANVADGSSRHFEREVGMTASPQ